MDRPAADDSGDREDDPILQRVLSDSAYDRVRTERFSHFKQPVPQKLRAQCLLLGALTLVLPLYILFPGDAGAYFSTNPTVASPTVLLLGLFALVIELGTAALLVGVALYRARYEPLDEDQALSLFITETFAAYLAFGTGALAVLVMLAVLALGLGGAATVGAYVEAMDGANPFQASGLGLSVEAFATLALACALTVYVAKGYAATRLLALD